MDNESAQLEQRCGADTNNRPGDIFHPDFVDGPPGYLGASIRNIMQPEDVAKSAISAGAAAMVGEERKTIDTTAKSMRQEATSGQ